jgi:Tol biopolymer transport system component/DNA-binding winged helix-turn-helix (wHTH) protein
LPLLSARFGPFELDLRSGELHQGDRRASLQEQSFRVLQLILENGPELTTREQIRKALWPDDTVVEFDHGINTTIKKIRQALGDSAEEPKYIQTVARRGYRCMVPVEWPGDLSPIDVPPVDVPIEALDVRHSEPSASKEAGQSISSSTVVPIADEARKTSRPLRRRLAAGTIAALLLMLVFLLVKLWRLEPRLPRVSQYTQLTHDGLLKTGFVTQAAGPVSAIVTDGSRVYFNESGPGNVPILAQVSAAGGETSVIPASPSFPQLLDISPDHSTLLVANFSTSAGEGSLWWVPVPAGAPHSIPGIGAWDATWSPDGKEIAYITGQDLYRAHGDGSEARKIVQLPGAGWRPRWSPDGRMIRLTLVDKKTALQSLWEVGTDGSGLHPLLPGWNVSPSECCGNWTPDGQYFVFQATRDQKTEIWAIREKGSLFDFKGESRREPFQLTSGQLSSLSPAVSPDGKKLYVVGRQLRGEVESWDEKSQQWLQFLSGISAEFVEFSPDGQWITYVSFPDGSLWKSRADGTERVQLTFAPLRVLEPHWSPDGKSISFSDYGHATQSRTYEISSNGGKPEPLTNARHQELSSTWSPDGKSVAFSYAPFVERSAETLGVFTLNLATHEEQKIPGSDGFISPIWSPDGRYLAALSFQDHKVVLFDFHKKSWTEVAPGYGLPRWSRDSAFLYYLQNGKDPGVMRMRINDRRIERVASLSSVREAGSMAGLVFGLTPSGAPIILRDTGTEEIYSLDWQED